MADTGPVPPPRLGPARAGTRAGTGADTRASPHRLFDLEPDLLPLFQYNCRQFSSPEDCLSSPEFLDHIRKVRGRPSPVASGVQEGAFLGGNEASGEGESLLPQALRPSGASAPFGPGPVGGSSQPSPNPALSSLSQHCHFPRPCPLASVGGVGADPRGVICL